ncbi:ATP-binding protein [Streptomyces rubradiris]|uniref:ATP-binding protein n=1 Tax=Streptomyces rubradiris TaxID=285531 RepID=UPI0036EDDDF4
MDAHGGQHSQGQRTGQPPAGPASRVPSAPTYAPGAGPGTAFLAWLRAPRPEAALGIWRLGYRPRPETDEDVPGRQLVVGALLSLLLAWFVWSLLYNGYLGVWWLLPLDLFFPDSWVHGRAGPVATVSIYYGWFAVVGGSLLFAAGRFGRWPEVWRRYIAPRVKRQPETETPPPAGADPAEWPQVRAAGAGHAAERLAADARAGLMSDVDYARIAHAWESVRSGQRPMQEFVAAVLDGGAGAWTHPSGARDLPARSARHDLFTHQVRLGTVAEATKNPGRFRGAGLGVDPAVLGSSLLAVGPSGSGKTARLVRPIAEALCLQALTGQAAVVVVGAADAGLGLDAQYDVVVRLGVPESAHALDLYGGATDPDEAAAMLAEALAGDLAGGDTRRAATALAQLLGPHHAAYGRLPTVPELRELLEGAPAPVGRLRQVLERESRDAMLRELDARERQTAALGDPGVMLADRLALLDRPAFATSFGTGEDRRAFSLGTLAHHPLRVRIDLPVRHEDASRVLARLLLAQFAAAVRESGRRHHFAGLLLDDATGVVTAESVRRIQHLRACHAGVVLTLRTLADVPEALHGPLYGAVGCHVALSGVTTWDGSRFARAWGTHWVEVRDVAQHTVYADKPTTRALHALRKLVTGKAVTTEAVTVRQVEREHWSASELAHSVPAGHAVVALSSLTGERSTPLLVDLRS